MRLKATIAALLFAANAHAFALKTGSWGYEYPGDWLVKPDGQPLALTGGQGFSFKGYIGDYWIDVNRCQAHAEHIPCPPNSIRPSFYTGTSNGTDHKGNGLVGTVVWNGTTYTNVGVPGSGRRVQFLAYGTMTMPPLGVNGQTKVKTLVMPITGSFEHGGVFTPITGKLLATVEFEQENGMWVIEAVDYDVVL